MCHKHHKLKENASCNSAAGRTGSERAIHLQSEYTHKKTTKEIVKILQW